MEWQLVLIVLVATLRPTIADRIDAPIPCRSPSDCGMFSSPLQDASCKDGFCLCKKSTEIRNCTSRDMTSHASRNTGAPIFRGCKLDHDCNLLNSFCNTTISQCECQKDFVFSSDKKTCLKKAERIDFPCLDDKQCLAYLSNTTCQSGLCNCIPGYHYAGNTCYKTIALDGACTRSEECAHVDGAVCTNENVCHCPAETVIEPKGKKCLPVARRILENCTENVQCLTTFSNAWCHDQICHCQTEYHFNAELNRCFHNKGLGENCATVHECYQSEVGNVTRKALECVKNMCVCAEDFVREDNRCVTGGGKRFLGSLLIIFATFTFSRLV